MLADEVMSGVYKILNKTNKKCYVGSSKDLTKRSKQHFSMLSKNKHHSIKLQNSYNKHGSEVFEFIVLEECPTDILLEREQYWMDKEKSYKRGYNCSEKSSYPTEKVKTSIYIKHKKYVEGFIKNIEELHSEGLLDKTCPTISFFGFNVDSTNSQTALFKRYWKASNILLGVSKDIPKLDPSKEYRLHYINYLKDGSYEITENKRKTSRNHDLRKSQEVLSLMLEDLLDSMQQHKYGRKILEEYEDCKKAKEEC